MDCMSKYDVLIIGGGPAASAAAIHAVTQGLTVCVFERELFPRERPGETLPPGVEPLFKQLGVLDAIEAQSFVRHAGIYTQWENDSLVFKPYQPDDDTSANGWYGYQAYRPILDKILLDHAKTLGANVLMPSNVKDVIYDVENKRVKGLVVNETRYEADYVIDASGGWHFLARKLKIPVRSYSKLLYAAYGYFSGEIQGCDGVPTLVADQHGWTWTAMVMKGLHQWTRVTFDKRPPKKGDIPESYKHLVQKGRTKSADVTWRMVDAPAGNGYFTVGDAAVLLDPASSHGVLRALMSGIKAADLIANVHNNICDDGVAIQEYNRWLQEWCYFDIQHLHELYTKIGQNLWQENTAESSA